MALKKKVLQPAAEGAALLPRLMTEASLPGEGPVELPLENLVPAFPEWNFYAPLPGDKMVELIDSIQQNGLLHPIVVWRQPGRPDMVLSGHNRLAAFRQLYAGTGDKRFAAIPATVKQDITAEQAREIIVDSNWVQRSLSPSERARSIYAKYVLAGRKSRSANGSAHLSNYEIIARQYGLSGRQIARYIKLGSLPSELLTLLDTGRLGVAAGVRLADFPLRQQKSAAALIGQYGLKARQASALVPGMTDAALTALLTPPPRAAHKKRMITVQVQLPADLRQDFLAMTERWLSENAHATEG